MADNLTLYNAVRSVPDNAKKPISAGRLKGKTDINPMWRIKALTEQFGPCGFGWYYEVTDKRMEVYDKEIAAFVDILLYVKSGGEWSKPIFGTGGNMFVAIEKGGPHVSDECYKMAITDAISVACKQLGFGADVYWEADRTKYDSGPDAQETSQNNQSRVGQNHVNTLFLELQRTGVGMKGILQCYKINNVQDMTIDQFRDAMNRLKKYPDKQPDPATIPPETDEEGLPWNTPAR